MIPPYPTRVIQFEEIDLDHSPKVRPEIQEAHVKELKERYGMNDTIRRPAVFEVEGKLLLADGLHRIAAAKALGQDRMEFDVHVGSKEQCIAFAILANARHGLKRSAQDKLACADLALKTWPSHGDELLAKQYVLSAEYLADRREVLEILKVIPRTTRRLGCDGKMRDLPPTSRKREVAEISSSRGEKTAPFTKSNPKQDTKESGATPPLPPLDPTLVGRLSHLAGALQGIWNSHPSFQIPVFRACLAEMKVVQEMAQLSLPGFAEPEPKAQKRFKAPTIQEVRIRAREIDLPETEAEKFHNFYESKGWKVGKTPMVKWYSALANWKQGWTERKKPESGRPRNVGDVVSDEIMADAKRLLREIEQEHQAEGHKK